MKQSAYRVEAHAVRVEDSVLPPPLLSYRPDRKAWVLEQGYTYTHGATVLRIPSGFQFDLASVPRFAWSLIAPFELSIVAPLLHDFLYGHGGRLPEGSVAPPRSYSRKEADALFGEVMRQERVAGWRARLAYWAVRWFGRGSWRG